jgi:hypothetical protein
MLDPKHEEALRRAALNQAHQIGNLIREGDLTLLWRAIHVIPA